jgi:hypothetical protein
VKPVILTALLLLASAAAQQAKLPTQPPSKTPEASPKEPETWMVTVRNVYKDPGEYYGHGEGDSLTILVHGETAVGSLFEYQGSQLDPSGICMTGTFHSGFLRLQNYPSDFKYRVDQIIIRGRVYDTRRGLAFRGRIRGGPFHSDAKGDDPHFPALVTLRNEFDELAYSPSMDADTLATDECACEWKKHATQNSFITAKCDSHAKDGNAIGKDPPL